MIVAGLVKRPFVWRSALVLVLASACGDDATTATGGGSTGGSTASTGGSSPSSTTLTTPTADSTASGDGTTTSDSSGSSAAASSSGDSSGESTGDTTGGVVAEPGTASQLVGVGQKMSSTNFTMVFTLGQPTQVQSTHSSTNYRLQGGLVGANGAPP